MMSLALNNRALSYKMDLDFWDCFRRKNSILQQKIYSSDFSVDFKVYVFNRPPVCGTKSRLWCTRPALELEEV